MFKCYLFFAVLGKKREGKGEISLNINQKKEEKNVRKVMEKIGK